MALFSRRPKDDSDKPSSVDPAPEATDAATDGGSATAPVAADSPDQADVPEVAVESAPEVRVSLSAFQGLGAQNPGPASVAAAAKVTPRAPGAETAPRDTETVPGLRDNVLVREALAQLSTPPTPTDLLNVARQLLQGHVFLRVKGDARALLAEGKPLPLAMATVGDKQYALAYSSGRALQAGVRADGDAQTSAMGQPTIAVIRHVLAGSYAGLILDHGSQPKRAVMPRELLERMLETFDETLAIKTRLAGERTPEVAAEVAAALTGAPLWVAVGEGPTGLPGIAEGRSKDGSRYLEVYSHPLEVAVMGRRDKSAPVTARQLAAALNGDSGLSGVVVDPAGPWIRLDRGELAPLFASAD